MSLIKLNKHEVYQLIRENLSWFESRWDTNKMIYHSRSDIECEINTLWRKEYNKDHNADYRDPTYDPPTALLYGSTLTAMVHDGVLERYRETEKEVYRYRPILPIDDNY